MKQRLQKAGLLLASLLISLLLGGSFLRAMGYETYYAATAHEVFWEYDPLLGWRHVLGRKGCFQKPSFRVRVEINQKGLRDDEHPYERTAGKKRILILGDSIVWGYGVDQDSVLAERLERLLPDVEVINAGVAGYSTDQEFLWLRSEGIRYHGDLVILVVSGNDDPGNQKDVIYIVYPKPRFTRDENGGLVLRNLPVPMPSILQESNPHGMQVLEPRHVSRDAGAPPPRQSPGHGVSRDESRRKALCGEGDGNSGRRVEWGGPVRVDPGPDRCRGEGIRIERLPVHDRKHELVLGTRRSRHVPTTRPGTERPSRACPRPGCRRGI